MGPTIRSTKRRAVSRDASAKRDRFSARLTTVQKELFQRAAELSGRNMTDFVLSVAQTAAEQTIRNYQVLELTARETEAFLEAIENPPPVTQALQEAIRDHAEHVKLIW